MMSEKQLKEKVYRLKNELRIYEEILGTKREGFGRPKGSLKYSQEQVKFLQENKDMFMPELIKTFNLQFGTNYHSESRALYNFMCREGILTAEARPDNHSKISPPIS